jgi:lysophospholipase L1-like esterase
MIGDSLTNSIQPDAVAATLAEYTFVGTQTAPGGTKHEGNNGYSGDRYVNGPDLLPFRAGGSFDIAAYLTTLGNPDIGWIVIALGLNNVFTHPMSTLPGKLIEEIRYINQMVDAFRAELPNARFVITVPPQGADDPQLFIDDYDPPLDDRDLWIDQKFPLVVDSFTAYPGLCSYQGVYQLTFSVDGTTGYTTSALHPNASGYTVMGNAMAAVILAAQ